MGGELGTAASWAISVQSLLSWETERCEAWEERLSRDRRPKDDATVLCTGVPLSAHGPEPRGLESPEASEDGSRPEDGATLACACVPPTVREVSPRSSPLSFVLWRLIGGSGSRSTSYSSSSSTPKTSIGCTFSHTTSPCTSSHLSSGTRFTTCWAPGQACNRCRPQSRATA